MSSYCCPVCGINDEWAYLRCYHPGCTDGRDSGIRAEAKARDAAMSKTTLANPAEIRYNEGLEVAARHLEDRAAKIKETSWHWKWAAADEITSLVGDLRRMKLKETA